MASDELKRYSLDELKVLEGFAHERFVRWEEVEFQLQRLKEVEPELRVLYEKNAEFALVHTSLEVENETLKTQVEEFASYKDQYEKAYEKILEQGKEIKRLQDWVADCQSGMYVNCVYCGHRYGPEDEVPVAMADMLKKHIEQCPKHPMSTLKDNYDRALYALKLYSDYDPLEMTGNHKTWQEWIESDDVI